MMKKMLNFAKNIVMHCILCIIFVVFYFIGIIIGAMHERIEEIWQDS